MTGQGSFWFGKSDFYNGVIDQSLRFDGSSSYLTKTPSSNSNRRKWTFSAWIKLSELGDNPSFFGTSRHNSSNREGFAIGSSQTLQYQLRIGGTTKALVDSDAVLRDTTNWYHIMMIWDSDNATAADRIIFYINNQRTGLVTYTTPVQYTDSFINSTTQNYIGWTTGGSNYLHGYMAEVNFVDGQALDPTSFGETKNGVWIPKAISGLTYGTNGFRLTFADSSSLGDDTSGNGNDYTSSGLASTDVVSDSPENNFCTLDPNFRAVTANTLSEGNLKSVTSSAGRSFNAGSFVMTPNSGKWYWEFKVDASSGGMGVAKVNGAGGAGAYQSVTSTGTGANTTDYYYGETVFTYYQHQIIHNGSAATSLSGSAPSPLIYGVGVDMDASPPTITYYDGGSSVGSANLDTGFDYIPIAGDGSGAVSRTITVNFGQDDTFAGTETSVGNTDSNDNGLFHDTVPSGHLALCSSNLSDTTLSPSQGEQADDYFNTLLYDGDGETTQNVTGVGFQPDFTWIKERTSTSGHVIQDSCRGYDNFLVTHSTQVESTGVINSVLADGFQTTGSGVTNQSSQDYVSWNWKAGGEPTADNSAGAGATPTSGSVKIDGSNKSDALAGTIAATRLSANTTSGFSVVTYTGNNGSSGTIAHGLNSAPEWVLIFGRNVSNSQMLGVTPIGFTKYASFQTTGGYFVTDSTIWNDTAPTSTVFTVGSTANVNDNYNYVAYCFHSVEGYSKIGTYAGNGNNSSDGPYVYLGFRPSWLFVKRTNNTGGAIVWDNKRSTFNSTDDYLVPQLTDDEEVDNSTQRVDFLSNGFKVKNGAASNSINGSGSTYLYLAFAEQPFKFSNAR